MQTRDLDIFFTDLQKPIHIASAGGILPPILADIDLSNEAFISLQLPLITESFEVEINPNLTRLKDISVNNLQNYLNDFVRMAKCGFYSYDKTYPGNCDNPIFHLVARPKNIPSSVNNDPLLATLATINTTIPASFEPFNLFQIL
ncbi:hypothetical protein [Chitinophaga sp. sic0106]|uniref:hypothetical protein n=1 Tax=Chitinophaga sp. sic0106 TaxID=2854785 RepID=UPI001C4703ED|nr:hypothetical protein [Chitinophaga sp. sic0106]